MRVLFCMQCRAWQVEGVDYQAVQDEFELHDMTCGLPELMMVETSMGWTYD